MDTEKKLPVLSASELRVLGALIEKSKTTPEYYPMTLNALTAACNQKTSRSPVVEYSEGTVSMALNSLKGRSLVAITVGGGSRVQKYKHNFLTVYEISDGELAVLCLLMLRGPQTAGELNAHSSRLHEFNSLEDVYDALNKLKDSIPPFVIELTRRPGQKEARFAHLLGGDVHPHDEGDAYEEPVRKNVNQLEERITALEEQMKEKSTDSGSDLEERLIALENMGPSTSNEGHNDLTERIEALENQLKSHSPKGGDSELEDRLAAVEEELKRAAVVAVNHLEERVSSVEYEVKESVRTNESQLEDKIVALEEELKNVKETLDKLLTALALK